MLLFEITTERSIMAECFLSDNVMNLHPAQLFVTFGNMIFM
jgi:hypothetical protein